MNKPINLHYFYSCIPYFFYFSILFFIFLLIVFGAGSSSAHMGWARPSQPSPALSLAQASDPTGPHEARVIQITRAWPLLLNSKQVAKMN
jgi:hypothetical protein